MSAMLEETARIDSASEAIVLPKSGLHVEVQDLRTRQLFKLMKILTRGAGHLLAELNLDPNGDKDAFVGQLLALVVLSIPEAENEAIEFLLSMVKPAGLIEGRKLTAKDKERNDELWEALSVQFENPEIEDTLHLIETIIHRESEDIQSLGKRLSTMLTMAQKSGPQST